MGQTHFWFMNINPSGGEEGYNKKDAFKLCHEKSIIGLGWPVLKKVHSIEEAEEELKNEKYSSNWKTVLKFLKEVDQNSYVWIYDKIKHVYYLCKVTSVWSNNPKSEILGGKNDIGWQRNAEWKEIPLHLVPSPILRNPHISTLCEINISSSIEKYLIKLFNNKINFIEEISDHELKEILKSKTVNEIIDLFDPYEIEDIVCNYIQEEGWKLIKSTASKSIPNFEAIFRKSEGAHKVAYVQVKSGKQEISPTEIQHYKKLIKDESALIYIFEQQKNNHYDFVKQITSEDIKEYIFTHLSELAPETRFKLYAQN